LTLLPFHPFLLLAADLGGFSGSILSVRIGHVRLLRALRTVAI
jgi:hypothetical protein